MPLYVFVCAECAGEWELCAAAGADVSGKPQSGSAVWRGWRLHRKENTQTPWPNESHPGQSGHQMEVCNFYDLK